jgi:glc operon protein GlcG
MQFLLTFVLCTRNGFAQAPPKSYGPPISLESAKKVASVAVAEAQKNNCFMAVAVVDPSCTLVYYEKMDNTQTGSANLAREGAHRRLLQTPK